MQKNAHGSLRGRKKAIDLQKQHRLCVYINGGAHRPFDTRQPNNSPKSTLKGTFESKWMCWGGCGSLCFWEGQWRSGDRSPPGRAVPCVWGMPGFWFHPLALLLRARLSATLHKGCLTPCGKKDQGQFGKSKCINMHLRNDPVPKLSIDVRGLWKGTLKVKQSKKEKVKSSFLWPSSPHRRVLHYIEHHLFRFEGREMYSWAFSMALYKKLLLQYCTSIHLPWAQDSKVLWKHTPN